MKVLFVAAECTPFAKTGGLADVVGSLPGALKDKNIDARVVLPKYRDIPGFFKDKMELKASFTVPVGWRRQYCGIEEFTYNGITFYFIDNKYYFDRPGLYGHYDEAERFVFFNRAVLEMLSYIDFCPDIIHSHDWQGALLNLLLKSSYPYLGDIKTVFTIHNLKYQGIFPPEIMDDLLGLGPEYFNIDGLEYYGDVNLMKAGLNYADIITTVSKTYAREIQTPYYGEGLDGILRKRADDLYGIINGIDYKEYNPEKNKHLFVNYKDSLDEKRKNKMVLQEMFSLPVDRDIPMLILISRMVQQKGFDLVMRVMEEILELDIQMVILGTGEFRYEQFFRKKAWSNSDKLSVNITFNEDLAHKIYAAGDLFLMPSKFEPCGIGQLIAFRYLTVPVVRETGGLVDTVNSYNEVTGEGNGFTFASYNAHDMLYTIKRALGFYHDRTHWDKIMENIKECNFSWIKSADEYISLYNDLLK
ncbi:MAG: glycogen synthase GlgA [Halanaerobiaceae bacterium]